MTPYYADPWLSIFEGDCRAVLREMEPESVHCVVTSPPYWGLRDYGTATWDGGDADCVHAVGNQVNQTKDIGTLRQTAIAAGQRPGVDASRCRKCGATRQDSQLGLEATPEEYVAAMVDVFREVRRVLRSDGTLWLNLGDSYASSPAGNKTWSHGAIFDGRDMSGHHTARRSSTVTEGLKPKDLVGIPWRVAFALQADGWYLRSDIIWSKPNPMPESVTDRPTKSHEYLFLLSKSPRYHFDHEAVREEGAGRTDTGRMTSTARLNQGGEWKRDNQRPRYATPNGAVHSPHGQGFTRRSDKQAEMAANAGGSTQRRMAGFNDRWDASEADRPLSRNLRSVWTIATAPYPGQHFAVFPPKLVEPCIKAGCPEGGTVLDPFAGTGTVGMVAAKLSRRAVLIDLNADYLRQCLARNAQTPLGLEAS